MLTDAYLAAIIGLIGLVAAAYRYPAVLRLRSEETAGRAEPLLAAPVSRAGWAAATCASRRPVRRCVLVAAGLGAGLAYGAASSTTCGTQVPRLVGAALAQLPAALVLAGLAIGAVRLLPRWGVASGLGGAVVVLGLIGYSG